MQFEGCEFVECEVVVEVYFEGAAALLGAGQVSEKHYGTNPRS
jgi:hypothetical protein